jgi:inosine-uridine nucleoside N-ribohydrolase
MTDIEMIKALEVPTGKVDVVLDTDTYNEIDDQFAVAYLLRSDEKLNCKAIYAAPFFNDKSTGPADGMEKSYNELMKILTLCEREDMKANVYRGSTTYLPDEKTFVESEAARHLVKLASAYTRENPLYVVAIGAITNVASAILMDKSIIDKIVVVWLGGHTLEWPNTREFNMFQDVAAARVVMLSKVPFVQLPCMGCVSAFSISQPELEKYLVGKNPLADYLAKNTIAYEERWQPGKPWAKPIWDVTAVAWLLNDNFRFMNERVIRCPIPEYDDKYAFSADNHFSKYIWYIKRNELFDDLFKKLTK